MPDLVIRKIISSVEEIYHEGGPVVDTPLLRGSIMAIIQNPFAGKYEPEIQGFMEDLKPLGVDMAQRLLDMLGGPDKIEGYGKGSLVGGGGELEHGALWHAPGGYAMRQLLGTANAIVPSSKKVGGVGARLDVPITHVNAAYVRSHFDGIEVRLNDAPRADEIMVAVAVTDSGRPLPRVGGLTHAEAEGKDGLR